MWACNKASLQATTSHNRNHMAGVQSPEKKLQWESRLRHSCIIDVNVAMCKQHVERNLTFKRKARTKIELFVHASHRQSEWKQTIIVLRERAHKLVQSQLTWEKSPRTIFFPSRIACSCARVLVCSCARVLVCSCACMLVCSLPCEQRSLWSSYRRDLCSHGSVFAYWPSRTFSTVHTLAPIIQ